MEGGIKICYLSRLREIINAYKALIDIYEMRRPFWTRRHTRKNIFKVEFKEQDVTIWTGFI
jgi:hypothetical protein